MRPSASIRYDLQMPGPLPSFADGPVQPAKGAVAAYLERLHTDYPASRKHRTGFRELGCEYVYAKQVPQRDYWGTLTHGYLVLIRLGGVLEERFGFTAELPAFYTPHRDLQIRIVDSLYRLLETPPNNISPLLPPDRQSVSREAWFLWAPDARLSERLDSFSKPHRTFVPLIEAGSHESQAAEQLRALSRRLYARDLYNERGYVTGGDFFGRAKLTHTLTESLLEQRLYGIFGTRKTGKTSVIKQVGDSLSDAPHRRVAYAYQDLEHVSSPFDGLPVTDFLPDLVQALRDALKTSGLRTSELSEATAGASILDFRRALDGLLQRLDDDAFIVIALDEVEYLCPPGAENADACPGGSEVGQFFGSLRKLTQERPNFAFLIAGACIRLCRGWHFLWSAKPAIPVCHAVLFGSVYSR